jgi:hypothetical protein
MNSSKWHFGHNAFVMAELRIETMALRFMVALPRRRHQIFIAQRWKCLKYGRYNTMVGYRDP